MQPLAYVFVAPWKLCKISAAFGPASISAWLSSPFPPCLQFVLGWLIKPQFDSQDQCNFLPTFSLWKIVAVGILPWYCGFSAFLCTPGLSTIVCLLVAIPGALCKWFVCPKQCIHTWWGAVVLDLQVLPGCTEQMRGETKAQRWKWLFQGHIADHVRAWLDPSALSHSLVNYLQHQKTSEGDLKGCDFNQAQGPAVQWIFSQQQVCT